MTGYPLSPAEREQVDRVVEQAAEDEDDAADACSRKPRPMALDEDGNPRPAPHNPTMRRVREALRRMRSQP
jgi:hypothetical protein